jgi:FimV-like protein
MGDVAGAREILDEVLRDGDDQQRESAQTLMQQLL